jgi:hypothetical protein
MKLIKQKTTDQRVDFIKQFAAIVKANTNVNNMYLISFADVNFLTEFYITDKGGKKMDLIELLSKTELTAYIKLVKGWTN